MSAGISVIGIITSAFGILKEKPIRLWGLSLMSSLLMFLIGIFAILPIISIPVTLVLSVGMASVFLDGYRGKEVDSNQLFTGFKSFWKTAGGMGWMFLWMIIWSGVPIANIIKIYSYRFVPYILLENDADVTATDALKLSMSMTKGYRGKMFLTDLLVSVVIMILAGLITFAMSTGIMVLAVLLVIVYMVVLIFVPLIVGLIGAAYFDEINKIYK